MMNMDQLFIRLPRDLQWEVLSEFAGTHSVHKGKLMRKLVLDSKYQLIRDMPRIYPCISGAYDDYYFDAVSVVLMSNGNYLSFGECRKTRARSYGFRKLLKRSHPGAQDLSVIKYIVLESSLVLSPFVKHLYPSFENTDKKKKNKEPLLDALRTSLKSSFKPSVEPMININF
jgi:hypothetical protein